MKKKILLYSILVMFILFITSCGSNTEKLVSEQSGAQVFEEESATEGTGFCANEFFPLRSDKVWEYTITYGDVVDPYSITFKDITSVSFTTLQTFEELTNEVGWECGENGMFSSTYANINYSGADVTYNTLEVEGVALPPEDEWKVGTSWGITYKVAMIINSGGVEVEAEGEIITSSQITAVETITVPAGTYDEAYRVDTSGEMIIDLMGTQTSSPLNYSDWYVRGVGLVKSSSEDPNLDYLMELVSFE